MRTVWAIARREFEILWFDARIRSVVFIAPFLYAGLFCLVYSNHSPSNLPIAVVQEDTSAPARQLVRMLEASPKLHVARYAHSVDELQNLIFDRNIDAAVVIPGNFTQQLKRGHDTHLVAYVNAASMVSANTAAKAINEIVQTFSAGVEIKALMKRGENLESARERFMPVKLDMRSLFNPSFNYTNFMVPGLLIAILQQVILLGVALSWTGEKEKGTLKELMSYSMSPWVLMAGKAIPYLAINFVVAEFYLRVLFPLNQIPMEGSWLVAIPYTLLFVLTVVTWGMWMSGLFRTRLFATQALMFVAMPSFILSGFTWPLEAMPAVVRWVGNALPMTHFVHGFRTIYLAGAPWRHVLPDISILLGFALLNIVLCYFVIHAQVRAELGRSA